MGWLAAAGAEIVRSRNESSAEMIMPHAVSHDAGGERVARIGEPFGESAASLGFRGIGGQSEVAVQFCDGGQCARRDDFLRSSDIASLQFVCRLRLFANANV